MVKTKILVWSVVMIGAWLTFNAMKEINGDHIITGISLLASIILWFVVLALVFSDVKENNNRSWWVVLTFLTAGFGGLIYSLAAKDNEVTPKEVEKARTRNFKGAAIFNYIIGGALMLIGAVTTGWAVSNEETYVAPAITIGIGLVFLAIATYLWKK